MSSIRLHVARFGSNSWDGAFGAIMALCCCRTSPRASPPTYSWFGHRVPLLRRARRQDGRGRTTPATCLPPAICTLVFSLVGISVALPQMCMPSSKPTSAVALDEAKVRYDQRRAAALLLGGVIITTGLLL